jgi:hypothetical protein
MEDATILHLVLTRFNVVVGNQTDKRGVGFDPLDRGWIEKRLKLFDKYCFPSVKGQSEQNFLWLVSFHPETDPEVYRKYQQYPNFVAVTTESFREMFERFHQNQTIFITTRLDSDDAIGRDFVKEIQGLARRTERESVALNFSHGLACFDKHNLVQDIRKQSNPFMSLIIRNFHRSPIPQTIFQREHRFWEKDPRYQDVRTATPMYIQVIHESNLVNHIKRNRARAINASVRETFNLA